MNMMNGYQQYKQQSVETMTSGEMLIMLFDGAIKNLTAADFALQKENYQLFDVAVDKTEKIIRYLRATLNMKYDISKELDRLYEYYLYLLQRLKAGRKPEVIAELKEHMTELRDTFREADRIAANQHKEAMAKQIQK